MRSPEPLRLDELGFTVVWRALGHTAPEEEALQILNVRSSVYRTQAGEDLFYVRGEVKNRSSAHRNAIQVAVEVRAKDRLLGRAESLANVDAGPEDLHMLVSRDNNELQRLLAPSAEGLRVPAREQAPFIAVFPLGVDAVEGALVTVSVLDGIPSRLRDTVKLADPVPEHSADTASDASSEPAAP